MSGPTGPWVLRRLASFLIRGPEAGFILADLDDAHERDVARGLPPWRARWRYATNVFASAYNVWRAGWWAPVLGISWLDVKLGARMLRKQPMLTGVAVLALGLGIPASLSVTHTWHAMMAPLPYDEGDRIVGVRNWDVAANDPAPRSLHDFALWREELGSFDVVGAASWSTRWNVQPQDGRAGPVRGAEITASAFHILRVPPVLGRTFTESDQLAGAPDVVVVGADLWESRFGRDPELVGETIRIGGVPHTVVGVMPEGFLFPRHDQIWIPLRADPIDYRRGDGPELLVFGRLADGISVEQARTEVRTVSQRMALEYPDTHGRLRGEVVTMSILVTGMRADEAGGPQVYLFQLLPVLLLMIVCGNVGVMILARTATRSGEISVRMALGAGRVRIVAQVFVETCLLSLLATGLGLVAANWSAGRFEAETSGMLEFPYWMDIGIGLRTALLALGLAVVCTGVACLAPALRASGSAIHGNLRRFAGRGSPVRFGPASSALIVAEIALSVGALSFGGAWTLTLLQETPAMGIELERYLSGRLVVPQVAPTSDQADRYLDGLAATQRELKRRIESEPGVRSVAVAMAGDLPGEWNAPQRVAVDGGAVSAASGDFLVAHSTVDVDFFRDMDRPILEGRDFGSGDLPEERGAHRDAAIVNTTFVEQVLGGRNPIGRRIRYLGGGASPTPWYEIVGVVGPIGVNSLNPHRDAGVYHPAGPGEINQVGFIIDTGDDPAAFAHRLRAIAVEVDPTAMIERAVPLSELAELEAAGRQYLAVAPVLLSFVAIFLSAAGLYALLSFTVAQRTREIGVRVALGARPRNIGYAIARHATIRLALGVALGGAFSAWVLAGLSEDPTMIQAQATWVVVVGAVAGTALVGVFACLVPTVRGLRVQPMEALAEG